MNVKNRNLFLVILVIAIGFLCVGGTYALLTFSVLVTNSSYEGSTTCFDIDYSAGSAITGVLFQSSTPQGGLSGSVTMNINSGCSINGKGTITLNVETSTGSLLLSEGALKYAVYEDVDSEPVSSGIITSTGDMDIYSNFSISKTAKNYYIYIWLDGSIADNDYADIPFSGYIHASASQIDMSN